jgi:phosphate transport system protein
VSKHLHRDLDNLQRQIVLMAGCVEEAIYKSVHALHERNPALARDVQDADDKIDELDNAVTEECLKLLALHQPVAIDLRRVTAVLMIATDLERMADLATDIANRAVSLASMQSAHIPDKLLRMTDLTTSMVRQSLDAFVNSDCKLAQRVIHLDDAVDQMNAEIIGDLIANMKVSPDAVEPNLSLFSAVRHLERIADHATNIAEDVLYLVDGEIVRHRFTPKADE